jgi:hypothetical protein
MAGTPTDLYAFGNRTGPRLPRPDLDLFADAAGNVGPEVPPEVDGASAFGDTNESPLTGHYHLLPAGTPLPEGLGVVADGRDVDPDSDQAATHHTIYPTVRMPLDRFAELFKNLPWCYAGKK